MPTLRESSDVKKYEKNLDQGVEPTTCVRGRTNMPCCIIFLVGLLALGYILLFSFEHGDPNRLRGLADYSGNICGISLLVEDKPYLYFCRGESGALTHSNRICVSSCEGGAAVDGNPEEVSCPAGQSSMYPAVLVADMYCMPRSNELAENLDKSYLDDPGLKLYMLVSNIWKSWPVIIVAGVFGLLLSVMWLMLISRFTECLVWTGLGIVVLGSGALGVNSLQKSNAGGYDEILHTGDSQMDFWTGVLFWTVSFAFLILCCWGKQSLKVAESCVKAASACIWDVESLLFQPWLALFIRLPITVGLFWGFVHLLSCVNYNNAEPVVNDATVKYDVRVRIHYSSKEYGFIGFYIVMSLWISEFLLALSHYVVAYATEVWFFTKDGGVLNSSRTKNTPAFITCSAYNDGMKYHLGTLAMGSFIIMFLRVPRMLLRGISIIRNETQNTVADSVSCLCQVCLSWYDIGLKVMTKDTWMDVAMNGNPFCQAAHHALLVLENEETTAIQMHGACWILQWAGITFITFFGGVATFICCQTCPWFNSETSEYYVDEPESISIIAALVSNVVAMPFLFLFNDVSDTILYCFAIETKREKSKPVIVQALNRHCCGRDESDPLAKVENRLEQPLAAQALLDKVTKGEPKKKDKSDRSCMEKTRACGH